MIRDWWMCTIVSVMFEFLEYSLEHQLPNFSECWWDHVGAPPPPATPRGEEGSSRWPPTGPPLLGAHGATSHLPPTPSGSWMYLSATGWASTVA